MKKIRYINFRYNLRNVFFITIVWIVSLALMVGDVMNTTARMTSQCRILEKPLLVSEEMYLMLDCSDYRVESIGVAQFRGKEKYTSLFNIYPKTNQADLE